jgi:hypothetical protein
MKTSPLLLCSLVPDVLQAIVMRSCGGMHSEDTDVAASAGDTAAALRLTCRTLRAAVNHAVKQLTMRATSSEDINQAAKRFPGVHRLFTNNTENTGLHINIAYRLTPASVMAGPERIHLRIPKATSRITIVQKQMPCLKDMRCALQRFANAHMALHLLASAVLPLPSQIEVFMQDHIGSPARWLWAARHAAHGKAVDVTQCGTQLRRRRGAVVDGCKHARGSCTAQ